MAGEKRQVMLRDLIPGVVSIRPVSAIPGVEFPAILQHIMVEVEYVEECPMAGENTLTPGEWAAVSIGIDLAEIHFEDNGQEGRKAVAGRAWRKLQAARAAGLI